MDGATQNIYSELQNTTSHASPKIALFKMTAIPVISISRAGTKITFFKMTAIPVNSIATDRNSGHFQKSAKESLRGFGVKKKFYELLISKAWKDIAIYVNKKSPLSHELNFKSLSFIVISCILILPAYKIVICASTLKTMFRFSSQTIFVCFLSMYALTAFGQDKVMLCTGKSSHSYHKRICTGLKQCGAKIIDVTIKTAIEIGKDPCDFCYGHNAGNPNSNNPTSPNKLSDNRKSSSTTSLQCQETTQKGTRCSRNAGSNGYCWQHD